MQLLINVLHVSITDGLLQLCITPMIVIPSALHYRCKCNLLWLYATSDTASDLPFAFILCLHNSV